MEGPFVDLARLPEELNRDGLAFHLWDGGAAATGGGGGGPLPTLIVAANRHWFRDAGVGGA